MDLCFITPLKLEERPVEELSQLMERTDGFVWLDVPEWSEQAAGLVTSGHAQLGLALLLMAAISGILLRWSRRQGWW